MTKQERLDEIYGEGAYELLRFSKWTEKCLVRCSKHGETYQTSPKSLFNANISGCPQCKKENLSQAAQKRPWNGVKPPVNSLSLESFIKKAQKKWGLFFDYSQVLWKGRNQPIEIICPQHGSFWQLPSNHLRSKGCKKCMADKQKTHRTISLDEFVKRYQNRFQNELDFSQFHYDKASELIKVTCPEHGEFEIRPYNLMSGHGCPHCNSGGKKTRDYFITFFESLGLKKDKDFKVNWRGLISPLEVDFWFPEKKLAIEFNGVYWHSSIHKEKNYHLKKKELCEAQGVNLIHIYETDLGLKREIVESRLKSLLGYSDRFFARKLEVREVDSRTAMEFLNKYHLQGSIAASVRLGLWDSSDLVSVMTFSKPRFNSQADWELLRYASKGTVIGGASKLFKAFGKSNVISYASRDWSSSSGTVYEKIGFSLIGTTPPSYFWAKSKSQPIISRYQSQKHKLKKLLDNYDDSKSETDNMLANGWLKIHNSGNLLFLYL